MCRAHHRWRRLSRVYACGCARLAKLMQAAKARRACLSLNERRRATAAAGVGPAGAVAVGGGLEAGVAVFISGWRASVAGGGVAEAGGAAPGRGAERRASRRRQRIPKWPNSFSFLTRAQDGGRIGDLLVAWLY